MRSLRVVGIPIPHDFRMSAPSAHGKAIGQAEASPMTAEEKSSLWDRISDGKAKLESLRPFVDWLRGNAPGVDGFFGDDAPKLAELMGSVDAPYSRSVEGVFSRIDGTDSAEWKRMTDQEREDVDTWASAVDEMWRMYLEHKNPPEERFVTQGLAMGAVSAGAIIASILLS